MLSRHVLSILTFRDMEMTLCNVTATLDNGWLSTVARSHSSIVAAHTAGVLDNCCLESANSIRKAKVQI